MCRYASEHVQTVVEGLGKAMACGYAWVWAGRWRGWSCVSGASVSMASVARNSKADEYQDSIAHHNDEHSTFQSAHNLLH